MNNLCTDMIHSRFQRKRVMLRVEGRRSNMSRGIGLGLYSVISGVSSGLAGIVVQPVREVNRRGAVGVLTGPAKAVVGVVTKPIVGIMDGFTQGTLEVKVKEGGKSMIMCMRESVCVCMVYDCVYVCV